MVNEYIEMRDVCKSFGNKTVLNKISLKVKQNEILGLLGPSGSGKSTILRILSGIMHIDAGELYVMGISGFSYELYSKIGIVMEEGGLYDRLSCFDNIKLFARIHNMKYDMKVFEALEKVKLKEDANTLVSKLSRGMRQRLLIARATLHNPRILLLDEPTIGLDLIHCGICI